MLLSRAPRMAACCHCLRAWRLAVHWCWCFACNPERTNWPSPQAHRVHPPSLPQPPSAAEEKREVSCPACDRRLRVPVSYAGTIGCPDCGHKFAVEASTTPPPVSSKPVEEEDEVEVVEEAHENPTRKSGGWLPGVRTNAENSELLPRLCSLSSCTNIFKAQDATGDNEVNSWSGTSKNLRMNTSR